MNEVMRGIADVGARGARFYTTDMCDGIAQGHDGMNFSLVSRVMITNVSDRIKNNMEKQIGKYLILKLNIKYCTPAWFYNILEKENTGEYTIFTFITIDEIQQL